MILLLLLLAAPERVTIVAKETAGPGLFAKLGGAVSKAWHRLYQRTDPDVDEGNALAAQNEPEEALKSYDRALERLPNSPELHFDRANAMLKLGSDHAMRAYKESLQAMETSDRSLKARASFDVALSHEEMGNPDEAIKAYENTLALDPEDRDAKVNLELLLKSQEERKQKQQVGQPQENKPQQNQDQEKPDKSKGEEQQKQEQKEAGGQEQKKDEAQQQAKEQEKKQAQAEEKPVDRSEAERLLDALRAGEKNLQTWRFAKDKRKEARHGEVEKDW